MAVSPSRSRSGRDLLLLYLGPQWVQVALLAALLFGSIGLQLVNPQIMRYFIDTARAGGALQQLTVAALAFIAVSLANQVLSALSTYAGQYVGWSATNALRADLALHCLRLDLGFHNARRPGEMIERIDGDVTALSNFLSQFALRVLGSLLLVLGTLAMLVREDWRVGLAMAVYTAVTLAVLNATRNLAVPYFKAERQANADLYGFIEERLAGLADIRANGADAYTMRRLDANLRELYVRSCTSWRMGSTTWAIASAVFALGYVLAFALGAWLYQAGTITIGTVFLFFTYTDMLRRPMEQLAHQIQDFQKAAASISRIQELFGLSSAIADRQSAELAHLPAGPLSVEFRSVSFAYADGRDAPAAGAGRETQHAPGDGMVLRDLSFAVRPGTVLGVLGRTGSGKTTLAKLLLRLYDPVAGSITVGGVDLRDVPLPALRRRIGVVTQDVQLFHATVRANLTLFDPDIPDERILNVLRLLGLWPWYLSLEHGLDTELAAGGGGLSAGEAQLLAFARVFLRDPGLVILDEASSRLDPATERLIERAVDRLLQDRTAVIIAHRLGTLHRADDVLILDDGRICEHGSRRQLAGDPRSRFYRLLQTGLEEALV